VSGIKRPEQYHAVLKYILAQPEPAFEDASELHRYWGRPGGFGVHDEVGRLRTVLVHRPGDELKVISADGYDPEGGALVDKKEGLWYFRSDKPPDLPLMRRQHDNLTAVLREEGVAVEYLDRVRPELTKSVFTRDPFVMTRAGAIVCRMGPRMRRGEELPMTEKLVSLGMPILRTLNGTAVFEGGSFCYLDRTHAAMSHSNRGNEEGIRQIAEVLKTLGVEVVTVPLTGYSSHIDGGLVMIAPKLALVNITRLPYPFLGYLDGLGIRRVEVDPEDDFFSTNCLSLGNGTIIMSTGAERTAERLQGLGFKVRLVDISQLTANGGGVHCSTHELLRDIA